MTILHVLVGVTCGSDWLSVCRYKTELVIRAKTEVESQTFSIVIYNFFYFFFVHIENKRNGQNQLNNQFLKIYAILITQDAPCRLAVGFGSCSALLQV